MIGLGNAAAMVRLALGALLLAGCTVPVDGVEEAPAPLRSPGSGIVVQGQQIRGGLGLLEALAGRVSNLRVERRGQVCPAVSLRGQRTLVGSTNPIVYVDGTPMVNTCILDQIRPAEVERVEVYPGGISGRTGYRAGTNGLILIFLTSR